MKVKLEKEKIETEKKNKSFLKIFLVVLFILMTLAIIGEIIAIIVLNDKIKNTEDNISKIPIVEETVDDTYLNNMTTFSNNLTIYLS